MKLYQYEELRKLNQALGSFKRNKIPIIEVQTLAIGGKVHHFVLTDPKYEPRPEKPKKQFKPVKPSKSIGTAVPFGETKVKKEVEINDPEIKKQVSYQNKIKVKKEQVKK